MVVSRFIKTNSYYNCFFTTKYLPGKIILKNIGRAQNKIDFILELKTRLLLIKS